MAKKPKHNVSTKLSERAMLASLKISMWNGMMHDQEVTEQVSETYKADRDAGRYAKRLVGNQFLSKVTNKVSMARRVHRTLTLPWNDDGTRILSVTGYVHYTQVMNDFQEAIKQATSDFLKERPAFIADAKIRLGHMFNKADFPDEADLKRKFKFKVEIDPIPERGDFRAQLSNDAVKAIADDIEHRSNERVEAAIKDIYRRVADVTGRMAEKLRAYDSEAEDKNIIRDSVVYNIHQLAELMPSLNITGDPNLDALAEQLKDQLVEHSPEILKTDANARKRTADAADRIFKKVSGILAS